VYYDPVHRLVLFDYRKSRGREGPDEMLKEFAGYLQTDGYNAYDHYENRSQMYPFGHEHLAQLSDPDQLAGKNIS
jgi:hypothetical protein